MSFVTRHFPPKDSLTAKALGGKGTLKGTLVGVCLIVAGCVNATPMADLEYAKPTGSAFNTALYHDYSYLAHSFGHIGAAAHRVFDYKGSVSLNDKSNDISTLANTYATKAVLAAHDNFIDPESSASVEGHEARDHLLRVLENGRDWYPRDAALAQANFDCWQLNTPIEGQEKAAARCKASFVKVLAQLETETNAQAAKIEAKRKAAADARAAARKKELEQRRENAQH